MQAVARNERWEVSYPEVTEEEISARARSKKLIHHDPVVARRTVVNGTRLLGVVASPSHLVGYMEDAISERFPQCVATSIRKLQFLTWLYAGALPVVTCEVEWRLGQGNGQHAAVHLTLRNGSEPIASGTCTIMLTKLEPETWFPTDAVDQPE